MLKVFCVFDSKACAYLQPFFSVTTAVAIRSFAAAARDKGSDFGRFAADFTLFELGTFDPVNGEFKMYAAMTPLGTALEYASADVEVKNG